MQIIQNKKKIKQKDIQLRFYGVSQLNRKYKGKDYKNNIW